MFKGIIIEESLSDLSLLKGVKIIKTDIEQVTEGHKTPWVKQWTLHEIEVPDDYIDSFAEEMSCAIDITHASSWYADVRSDLFHYVIFSHKFFKIDRSKKENYMDAVEYGAQIGIPSYQLDFSAHITEWKRLNNNHD